MSTTPQKPTVTMPLEHALTYQAFCEITNFIRDNGYDWEVDFATPSLTR